jgi:proteasome component ECM29
VESRFEQMWTMTLRALDDIKESVRVAAAALVRTLRGLTLRVADPELSPAADAAAAIKAALPLLLAKGARANKVKMIS